MCVKLLMHLCNTYRYISRKVCVSNADHLDANGLYKWGGIHCGKPAYYKECGAIVLWICYTVTSDAWCLVKNEAGEQQILYSFTCRHGHAGLDHGKLPVGCWLGPNGAALCNIAYKHAKKAG